MLQKEDLLNLNFYKKTDYTGSIRRLCYKIEKDGDNFLVTSWPGPYCFDKTPGEVKSFHTFEFTMDALQDIADYLNRESEKLDGQN